MSNSVAPALVSSPSDLIEYNVEDSSPVDPKAKKGYQERFIHSEIYKRFPDVNSVIHSHSEAVLPFTMNGVPMRPAFHIAGFLGTSVPTWDITSHYNPDDTQDMLVNTQLYGFSLAKTFSKTSPTTLTNPTSTTTKPDHNVVLMANHGFTTVGNSIQQAVYRAVYTQVNAGVQSNAITLRHAFENVEGVRSFSNQDVRYLNERQTLGTMLMNDSSQERPWGLWVREVQACPLYINQGNNTK